MLFNTYSFLVFSLVVFGAYYLARHRTQNRLLLVASYVFYGAWDARFLALIAGSTLVDFYIARAIAGTGDARRRRWYLNASCTVNLGALGFFKYFDFFVESAEQLVTWMGFEAHTLRLDVVLPVGISFYTFQTMSYTIDVYRRRLEPCTDLLDFALYVSFFPQLVAGPIERASNLLPQIVQPRRVSVEQLRSGFWLITWGLFKKGVVADNLATIVDRTFSETPDDGLACLLAVYAFAYQIYCDFSGYSDIARGLSKLMGIELMKNFAIPYVAKNPQEFWSRWHISLSSWLRDYVYIPLGGNRHGHWNTYRNLMLTMVLGGLWHGAAWTFVAWGAYHGLALCGHRAIGPLLPELRGRVGGILVRVGWFHVVCGGWLLFRAANMAQVGAFLSAIGDGLFLSPPAAPVLWGLTWAVGSLWAVEALARNSDDPLAFPTWRKGAGPALATALWLGILFLTPPASPDFIYFQF